jgi:hypothetical protein
MNDGNRHGLRRRPGAQLPSSIADVMLDRPRRQPQQVRDSLELLSGCKQMQAFDLAPRKPRAGVRLPRILSLSVHARTLGEKHHIVGPKTP